MPPRRSRGRILQRCAACVLFTAAALASAPAMAQATLKPDGQWRHLITAGANFNSGNTRTTALNLSIDSVRATPGEKWSVQAQGLHAASAGSTTAERLQASTQYNRDLSPRTFGFGQVGALHDRPANLQVRLSTSGGFGLHLMKKDDAFWDAWAGVSVSQERYVSPVTHDGAVRERASDAGLLFAEESVLRLTDSTRLKQKLVFQPSLREPGRSRTEFDSQLTVAINARLNLSVGLSMRYSSRPPPGVERLDTALVTGLALRID